jgi:CubicO group peptidase (beta-lactamase class C family)
MRVLVFTVLLAVVGSARHAEKQSEVNRIFSEFNTHTPGCAVGVAHKGSIVFAGGYGMADLERNVPITPDTVFESGSVAKQFTAAALMLLAKQGRISLDDPMRKYLPELPESTASVTIRHVLSHVSGLRDWRAIAVFAGLPEGTYVYSNEDLLKMAARQKALNFDPATNYSYSNIGFNMSPILVDRALDGTRKFQSFTRDHIFEPLGMSHTRWRDDFRAIVPGRALAYRRLGGGDWIQQTPIENIIGAGGMLTTIGDLLLWNENFTHAKVGGHEFVKAQQTPAALKDGRTIAYAAGLMIATVDGLREVAHSGSTGGYRTWLGRYPDQSVSVAVLCNSAQVNAAALGRNTARLWTGVKATQTSSSTDNPGVGNVQALAGMYRKKRDNTVAELRWSDGKLMLDSATELIPVAQGRFSSAASQSEYNFDDGPPVRLRVVTGNGEIVYERVDAVHPIASELAQFVGQYGSDETGSTLAIALAATPGELTYRIGSQAEVLLRPTFRDAFMTPSGSSIHFNRDSSGKVLSLSVGDDRVWDLRFTRKR